MREHPPNFILTDFYPISHQKKVQLYSHQAIAIACNKNFVLHAANILGKRCS